MKNYGMRGKSQDANRHKCGVRRISMFFQGGGEQYPKLGLGRMEIQ
jgi:hypothetical protein